MIPFVHVRHLVTIVDIVCMCMIAALVAIYLLSLMHVLTNDATVASSE